MNPLSTRIAEALKRDFPEIRPSVKTLAVVIDSVLNEQPQDREEHAIDALIAMALHPRSEEITAKVNAIMDKEKKTEYRMLGLDEMVVKGDQFFSLMKNHWMESQGYGIVIEQSNLGRYRRKLLLCQHCGKVESAHDNERDNHMFTPASTNNRRWWRLGMGIMDAALKRVGFVRDSGQNAE